MAVVSAEAESPETEGPLTCGGGGVALLARADGASPVEYLTDNQCKHVRDIAVERLRGADG